MKGFKKGIALIAVLAFLITAILPVSGLAAGAADGARLQTVTFDVTAEEATTVTWDMTGFNLGPTDTNPAGKYVLTGTPSLADAQITVGAPDADGKQTITAALPAAAFSADDIGKTYTYGFCFQGTNWQNPGNAMADIAFNVTGGSVTPAGWKFEAVTAEGPVAADGTMTAKYTGADGYLPTDGITASNPAWTLTYSGTTTAAPEPSVNPANGESTLSAAAVVSAVAPKVTAETEVTVEAKINPAAPSSAPTDEPSGEPTNAPTDEPSGEPTNAPTDEPSGEPTTEPTDEPSGEPTNAPATEARISEDGTTLTWTVSVQPEGELGDNYTVTIDPDARNWVATGPGSGNVDFDEETGELVCPAGGTVVLTEEEASTTERLSNVIVTAKDGSLVQAKQNAADGTWSFTMPAQDVTVTVTTVKADQAQPITAPDDATVTVDGEVATEALPGETVTVSLSDGSKPAVLDANGNLVPLAGPDANGAYTFEMPASAVTVSKAETAAPAEDNKPANVTLTVNGKPLSPGEALNVGDRVFLDGTNGKPTITIGGKPVTVYGSGTPEDPYYFVAEAGEIVITEGTTPVKPTYPDPNKAGIVSGSGKLGETVDGTNPKWATDPFTYWMQPVKGLFADAEDGDTYPTAEVPVELAGVSDSLKNHYQIGPKDVAVSPVYDAAGEHLQPNDDLTLNKRIQVYYNPDNIAMPVVQVDKDNNPILDKDGKPVTKLEWLNNCNWQDYVTMEWEYKPSTKDEDDGNPLKIPAGFGFSGIRSPLLTISPLTEYMDGWWVRLAVYPKEETGVAAGANLYWTTRWIRIDIDGVNGSLDPEITITSNPEAVGSVTNVSRGGDVVFTANVAQQPYGSTLSYQWQSLAQATAANPTPAWTDIAGATSGNVTVTNVTDAMSGVSYRCIVTCVQSGPGGLGTVNTSTNYLTLNVTPPDGSVYIPESNPDGTKLIYKLVGDTLQAQISARTDNSDPVKYQWYVRSYLATPPAMESVADAAAYLAGAASQEIPGATGASLTSEPLQEGVYAFRCRVENATNPAKAAFSPIIYVVVTKDQIEIYPHPGDIISAGVVNGHALTLKAWARAAGVSYNWQRYNPASGQWTTLTATGQNLVLPALTTEATGTLYRCAISTPGAAEPIYTGWYLINVWDTANTPVVTSTAQNLRWTLSQFKNDYDKLNTGDTMELLKSSASVAQNLDHGLGPVVAVWYSSTGRVVACDQYRDTPALQADHLPEVSAPYYFTTEVKETEPGSGRYESTLSLNYDAFVKAGECASATTAACLLNGTYYCVWYKPQTLQEYCFVTECTYDYQGKQDIVPVDMTNTDPGYMQLLAPQATRGTTAIQIQIPGDPWIITNLADRATVSVDSQAVLSVAAAITQPSDTTTPVYTWQVTEDGGKKWRNCLSSDGTGQFTSTFTTRTITQDDFDTNTTLSYRVIVASRPNVAKIVSSVCELQITEGTPAAPVITPGSGSPIKVENGQATGVTVSKDGATVSSFLDQLNMTVPAGYTLRIAGSDGEALASDAVVYTGCILQLVENATDTVASSATIIVAGDVLGTGIIGINQVVRMAQDLNGTRPLEGIYEQAGDFNGSGSIDIADLVREAQILSEPVDVQK